MYRCRCGRLSDKDSYIGYALQAGSDFDTGWEGVYCGITEQVKEIIKGNNFQSVADVSAYLKDIFKDIIQELLEAELEAKLGYAKDDVENKNTDNSRNGYSAKTIKSEFGEVEIQVPRDRKGEFKPQIIPRYQRDVSGIEEKVIALYARGMSTRDISEQIEELYGFSLSTEMVSKITDRIAPEIKEWQTKTTGAYIHICLYRCNSL